MHVKDSYIIVSQCVQGSTLVRNWTEIFFTVAQQGVTVDSGKKLRFGVARYL